MSRHVRNFKLKSDVKSEMMQGLYISIISHRDCICQPNDVAMLCILKSEPHFAMKEK